MQLGKTNRYLGPISFSSTIPEMRIPLCDQIKWNKMPMDVIKHFNEH